MNQNKDTPLRSMLVVALTVGGVFAGNMPLKMYLQKLMNNGNAAQVYRVAEKGTLSHLGLNQGLEFFYLFFPFIMALAGLLVGFGYLLQRPISELIRRSGPPRWSASLKAGVLWMGLALTADLILSSLFPDSYQWDFQWKKWLSMNFWLLLFIPFQTAAEELFFRGFLTRRLGGWGYPLPGDNLPVEPKQYLRGLIFPALLFTLLHLPNPELQAYGYLKMLPQYLAMAFFLGWLSWHDRGVERSWGVHLANNWYGIAIVNFQGSSVPSHSAVTMTDYRPLAGAVAMFISMGLFLIIYRGREKRFRKEDSGYLR